MMPLTPRDGSEVSVEVIGNDASGSGISTRRTEEQREYSGGASGLGLNSALRKAHRRSISFDIESSALNKFTDEQKRKERRRSEAKAAIEVCFFFLISLCAVRRYDISLAWQCHQRPRPCPHRRR